LISVAVKVNYKSLSGWPVLYRIIVFIDTCLADTDRFLELFWQLINQSLRDGCLSAPAGGVCAAVVGLLTDGAVGHGFSLKAG